ncbi:hypothetical protein B9Z55_009299 [Caenorhabditis nigoni]|uniref:F-box domain-containing protein n=1 Tax=Caenorhabditis nigoni TaxID=1611254 RepID=A0A2G5URI9_9PELO|nr:hypothetical protein B9Z55_009299 [Caenorhabditis nigoni]
MPFPILHTPFVVLSEIINILEPNEIVTASFCSKNMRRLLKNHYQRRKPLEWKLIMIDYAYCGQIDIETSEDDDRITVIAEQPYRFERTTLESKIAFNTEFLELYFEDHEMGIKMIVEYVTDLFNIGVYGLDIDRNGVWAIDWISEWQEKMLARFEFYKNSEIRWNGDATIDYVLRNARASDYYNVEDVVSNTFQFDGKLGPMKQLYIPSEGQWVTLNNLINFNANHIVVRDSRLSVPGLYAFIRHWSAGGSPQLTFLKLEFEDVTDFENFEEQLEVVETDVVGDYRLRDRDQDYHFDNGCSIQRNDGVKAVIEFDIFHFVMMVFL